MYPEDSKGLYESYLDATRNPHGYLILHLAQDTDYRLLFRTHIFPSEVTVVYAPVGYEKDTVELSPFTSAQERVATVAKSHPREFEQGSGVGYIRVRMRIPMVGGSSYESCRTRYSGGLKKTDSPLHYRPMKPKLQGQDM